MAQIKKHADHLAEDVTGITFSEPDGPITTSIALKDDATTYFNCRPLSELELPFTAKTIYMSALTELDRLASHVDKASYSNPPQVGDAVADSKTIAAFKYWFMPNGMFRQWYEMHDWIRLPRDHSHIVPFDAVVLSDVGHGIMGFTSLFIPGGTLNENDATVRPFQLRWLHQLFDVVDYLNYELGVMNQDIAPRNILIDEQDNLRIFNFNFAIMIGEHYTPERNDARVKVPRSLTPSCSGCVVPGI